MITGNIITDSDVKTDAGSGFDIVVANILPVVLIPLTPVVRDVINPSGIVIYSGILSEKAPAVKQTLEDNNFEIISEASLGEWCVIVSKA